jgi:hypothetical protein
MDAVEVLKRDNNLIQLFKNKYPNFTDNDIFDCISDNFKYLSKNIIESERINIINQNFDLANKNISQMLIPTNLILCDGKINNVQIKILFDTGSTSNFILKTKIQESNLDNLIDETNIIDIQGIYKNININKQTSCGNLWCIEIEFVLNAKNDNNEKFIVKDLNNDNRKINTNFIVIDDAYSNMVDFDVILGLDFIKFYKVNIDFAFNIITLQK